MNDETLISVDRYVPIPPNKFGKNGPWPFVSMEVGDSFECPADANSASSSRVAASRYKKLNPGFGFTIRKTEEGYRLWRTK